MALASEPFGTLGEMFQLFARTREALAEYLIDENVRDDEAQFIATAALEHLDQMRDAFKWSLRATAAPLPELRYVVRQADVVDVRHDPAPIPSRPLARPELDAFAALHHAQVIFGLIPRMPAQAISFPGRKSYADIPVPRGPAEFVGRLEEIERALWDAATRRPLDRIDPLGERRAYSFFDASTYLAVRHVASLKKH